MSYNNKPGWRNGSTRWRFRLWRRRCLLCVLGTEEAQRRFETIDIDILGELIDWRQLPTYTAMLSRTNSSEN